MYMCILSVCLNVISILDSVKNTPIQNSFSLNYYIYTLATLALDTSTSKEREA